MGTVRSVTDEQPATASRTGTRPLSTDPILDSARTLFGLRGYASTTVKSIAAAAQVAPGIVLSLYVNKEELFAAAMRLPFDPSEAVPRLIAPGLDGMGERLVRMTLSLMEDADVRRDLASAALAVKDGTGADRTQAVEQAVRTISEYLQVAVVDRIVSALGMPDARMRAALVTSLLGGMAGTRYALRVEPLASASHDEVIALFAPMVQHALDPTRPLARPVPRKGA